MIEATSVLITIDNYKNYINKKVYVEITCYQGGLIYPDNNILIGMNKDYFYFISEKGTDEEVMWHWETNEEKIEGKLNCSIQVWSK